MEWLNYHHLLYFWMVVRTGSVAAASTELKLASPTISVQIRRLEEQLGEKLLRRAGRHVVPTEMGQVVYRYADEIFALGRELVDTARGRPTGRPIWRCTTSRRTCRSATTCGIRSASCWPAPACGSTTRC